MLLPFGLGLVIDLVDEVGCNAFFLFFFALDVDVFEEHICVTRCIPSFNRL
jgi:hypothetical protein